MSLSNGKPKNLEYLECDLPPYLEKSLIEMKKSWEIVDSGGRDNMWDCSWNDLASSINSAEVDEEITKEQASYLRKKYLRMEE